MQHRWLYATLGLGLFAATALAQSGPGAAPAALPRPALKPDALRPQSAAPIKGLQLKPELLEAAKPKPVLWGWADLHAHPASHLSFGADAQGNNGILWGKPGLRYEDALRTVASDMPPCSPDKHGSFDADVVRHLTHQQVISTIDNITGFPHQANGGPGFGNWPNARSLTHQQMHVTSIRRAYDGGQRLMIASTTNNQMLSLLWERVHYDPGGALPLTEADYDYKSAKRQLAFIKDLASANRTWMEIAYSAADARRIIAANKLALILSIELDSLTPEQMLRLVNDDGVRHVIPIHLIDNKLGGAAVYSDAFNAATNFVNGGRVASFNNLKNDGFFRVVYDTKLRGRLNRPQTLVSEGFNMVQGGAVWPRPVDDATFARLSYDLPPDRGGHRNALGLSSAGRSALKQLAQKGILLDVVHMSQQATDDTLSLLRTSRYPLMNSHTGLREADETAENERALKRSAAGAIAELGGVIGLGTEGTAAQHVVLTQTGTPLVRFTGGFADRAWQISRLEENPVVSNLTVTIKTGGDDLRGGNNRVWAWVQIAGRKQQYDLSQGQGWPNGSIRTTTFALPANTRLRQIESFALHTDPNAKNGLLDDPDNWNVDELKVEASFANVDTVGGWLAGYREVLELLGDRGAAMGTDINGFAPQVPFSAQAVTYPIRVASRVGTPPAGYTPPALERSRMGNRTFDFKTDGIAHYGMLPDFIQAVSQKPGSEAALQALFRSANDVVEMWEKCEATAPSVR
jgi:microsomal dipeptidase-like Zn-dependent dipeptidase